MRLRLNLFFLLLTLCSPLPSLAQTQAHLAASRISAVTVFADRAQVTRSARLALKPGTNLVSFEGLPVLMFEDSLRAEGSGSGPARIAGITVKTVFLEKLQEKRIQELEQEIEALSRQVEGIEARVKSLAAQRAFIESIRVGWGERISKEITLGKPSSAELGDAAKFVGDGIARVEEGIYAAEASKKPLLDRSAALQKELEKVRGNRQKQVRTVEVAIEAQRAMQFDLVLSYLVGQAHWEPVYDVRLAADGASAEITYRAQVWQRSGEDWPGVKLSLSSAAPEAGGAPPELLPWQISLFDPSAPVPMARGARTMKFAAPAAAPAPMQDLAAGSAPEEATAPASPTPALPVTAGIAEGETSVLFDVALPADIPADGTRASSVIAVEKLPVSAEFVTTPKLSERVYLKSQVTNSTAYPLLAGWINVFNDTVFTGKSRLKTVAAGEKFDLFFGADDRIKVKREVSKVRKQAGILGSNRLSYACRVELTNFKKRPVSVTLLDQVPIPGNAELKVSLEDAEPKPASTGTRGETSWKLDLAPGEKKVVRYDIVIEYPKGRELLGAE